MKAPLALFIALALVPAAHAHDIYTGVYGKGGQLCCGGSDCAVTSYRERGGEFEFLTRERHWISIPAERITFLPIPGDPPSNDSHKAHLCYREPSAGGYDTVYSPSNVFTGDGQSIFLYCAFIQPGGV